MKRIRHRAPRASSVLVLGDYRQSLAVTRSLHRAGYHVISAALDGRVAYTRFSASVDEHWNSAAIKTAFSRQSSRHLLDALLEFLSQRPDVRWIFPVGETDVSCISQIAESLRSDVGLVMTSPATFRACIHKPDAYAKAAACDIPVPPLRMAHDLHTLRQAGDALGYPFIVKPASGLNQIWDEKALIVHSLDDLTRQLQEWPRNNAELIVQRFAPGRRRNCHFLADEGRLLAYFEQSVTRTTRANGTGYGTEGCSVPPCPDLRNYCERFLGAMEYSGVGCIQFLVDEASRSVTFLEINPRLDATCALAVYCGYDFPRLALDYARYQSGLVSAPPRGPGTYPRRRMVWLLGQVEGLGHEFRRGRITLRAALSSLFAILRATATADVHLLWSWRDPLPSLYLLTRLVSSQFKSRARRARRAQ